MTTIEVKCSPDSTLANKIRFLICQAQGSLATTENPLTNTNFNAVLDDLIQKAFDEGRAFQASHPDIKL